MLIVLYLNCTNLLARPTGLLLRAELPLVSARSVEAFKVKVWTFYDFPPRLDSVSIQSVRIRLLPLFRNPSCLPLYFCLPFEFTLNHISSSSFIRHTSSHALIMYDKYTVFYVWLVALQR